MITKTRRAGALERPLKRQIRAQLDDLAEPADLAEHFLEPSADRGAGF